MKHERAEVIGHVFRQKASVIPEASVCIITEVMNFCNNADVFTK